MKPYIPELSEQRMVRRAPNRAIDFGPDRDYIFDCLKNVEASFGLQGFPGLAPEQIPARALIKQFIVWWRMVFTEAATEITASRNSAEPGALWPEGGR